jgi:tetratricopeptide (TPR) repeat protein
MKRNLRLWAGLLVTLLLGLNTGVQAAAAAGPLADVTVRELLKSGMDALFNMDYVKAWADFQKVKELKPDTPLGAIFESEFYWWRIFNSTGDFYNLDFVDSLKTSSSAFDDQFISTMEKAFVASDSYLKSHPNDPEAYFYLGMSQALRSRLEAGRDHTLAVVKYVRKSHDYLEQCLKLDPNFKDANLGLGAYHFYVEEYGGIFRPLRFLIRLPAGDRQEGIRQLWEAAGQDDFTAPEARFFLASIYLRESERNYAEAEKILTGMVQQYPNNPIFRFALAISQKQQHKNDLALENLKKVANHALTPQVGDLAVLVKKELESLGGKASPAGH